MAAKTSGSNASAPARLIGGAWIAAGLAAGVVLTLWLTWPGGDGREAMIRRHIDGEWFRRSLVEDNLAHWLAAAVTDSGFFRSALDRRWRPAERQVATLVSQSRLLFVMAAGYEVTGREDYIQAVRKGADFLLSHFRDEEHGGWFWAVDAEGHPVDMHKDCYGHAFVIFGLSHAGRVTGEERYLQAALETWGVVKSRFRDELGGIYRRAGRDWSGRSGHSQNPMMHLFEALLALHDATGSQQVLDDARALAEFIFTRLYDADAGCLPEEFDELWRPLPAERGGRVDLGHQFEWAFLLSRAVAKGFPPRYLQTGRRLLEFGMAHGFDAEAGGIFSSADYSGKPRGQAKGWWQQCEHLRALMHYAAEHGQDDLWGPFEKSLAFVREHFIDSEYGGWYASAGGGSGVGRKGSAWKVGYHTTGMYLEALRLAGELGR